MKRSVTVSLAALGLVVLAGQALNAQDLEQKIGAAKQAAAENKQALLQYSWIEQTQISVKGEVKNTRVDSCQYGPDGRVQKTPLSEPPQQDDGGGRRGRRGRLKEKVIEKKKAEMKEEMQSASALVHRYLPPDPEKIQAAKAAGRITITPGSATTALTIADYEKEGDSLVLTLDPASRSISRIGVNTWLDQPDQKVTLDVQMGSLPDGPRYPGTILLSISSSQIDVKIKNSNYERLAP